MKKDLGDITEKEVKTICKFYNEPYISYMTSKGVDGYWDSLGLAVSILTTSTTEGSNDDSNITIHYNGNIRLSRNNGGWGGMRDIDVNPLLTIDYLRLKGYAFDYDIPEEFQAEFKRLKIKKKIDNINDSKKQ